jgi:glycosyltransferase involved in cell wall biosynthesis
VIRVAALTSGRITPSSRFRVRQQLAPLSNQGFDVREFIPRIEKHQELPGSWVRPKGEVATRGMYGVLSLAKLATRIPGIAASWTHDLTWLERELFAGRATLERFLKRPLVFDVDDAIWLPGLEAAEGAASIARRASAVIAGNAYLAEWFVRHNPNVHIVNTGIDTDRFAPSIDTPPRRFVVGWIGSSSNFRYLLSIEDALTRFLSESDAELVVVANKPSPLKRIREDRLRFLPWSEESEVGSIHEMDVGIMPLIEEDWARGKCGFKMLQYMACGLPVVASPVGLNSEILSMADIGFSARTGQEWSAALCELYRNREQARMMGQTGRELVVRHFNRAVIAEKLAAVFRTVL